MPRRLMITPLLLVLSWVPLGAHDFWLSSTSWSPAAGTPWTVTAQIGERFPTAENGPRPERVDSWRVLGAQNEVPLDRAFRSDKAWLATDVPLPAPGAYLGVMTITASTIEMKGPEFMTYLREEGLTGVISAREAAGAADAATRERYARYAKIAVRTGSGSAAHLTQPVGMKAELVPATDPTSVRAGQAISVRLLVDGRPVSDAAVTAVGGSGGTTVSARTTVDGQVTLRLDKPGAWLIKTVHMTKLPPGSTEEWESFWVTLALNAAS